MRRTFYELVKGFAEASGCGVTAEEGSCRAVLSVEGLDFHLGLIEASGMLVIQTGVAVLPAKDREAFYADLMAANNLFSGTQGLTLGLDRDQDLITVQVAWEMEHLNAERFANLMDAMGAMAVEWMVRLDEWRPGADGPEASDDLAALSSPAFLRV